VEGMWGLRLEHPVETMREYVEILRASFREGNASFTGTYFTARWAYAAPRNPDLPIVVAAIGEKMLEMAGELADGVSLWMCSPAYVRDVVIPHVRAGRQRAGKSLEGFEIMAAVPVCLVADLDRARAAFRQMVERYAGLPFYRKVLDASGFKAELERGEMSDAMLHELSGIGDAAAIKDAIERYRAAGVTLPTASPMPKSAGAVGVDDTLEAAIA
jgi:alkanesulfonate monooxygenase SsuD/methylene tetrahydromethanopterin reductase-like flavin-dependent oxidoreductase (luciferase family)